MTQTESQSSKDTMKVPEAYTPREFFQQAPIFFVESPTDSTVLIAMDFTFEKNARVMYWWDSTKERVKEIQTITSLTPQAFSFRDMQNVEYRFSPLTLDLYKQKVKFRIRNGQDFQTEQEMVKAFQDSKNYF